MALLLLTTTHCPHAQTCMQHLMHAWGERLVQWKAPVGGDAAASSQRTKTIQRAALMLIGTEGKLFDRVHSREAVAEGIFGASKRYIVDGIGLEPGAVHTFVCADRGLHGIAAIAAQQNLTLAALFASNASTQHDRLYNCLNSVVAHGLTQRFSYTWFIRTRLDLAIFGPLPDITTLQPCVYTKLRAFSNIKGVVDDHISIGWGPGEKGFGSCLPCRQPCLDANCTGRCPACFTVDDQFALVPAKHARVYFANSSSRRARLGKITAHSPVAVCETRIGGEKEAAFTKWLFVNEVCVRQCSNRPPL